MIVENIKSIVFSPVFWRSKDGKWALKYKDEESYTKGYKYEYMDDSCNQILETLLRENNYKLPEKIAK